MGRQQMIVVDAIHAPTRATRQQVVKMVGCGLSAQQIAFVLGCMEHEIKDHYQQEMEHGVAAVTALVGGALLKQALRGDVNASRFWLQSRAKWTIPQHVELTGRDGGPVLVEARRATIARVLALAAGKTGKDNTGTEQDRKGDKAGVVRPETDADGKVNPGIET